MNYCMKCGGEGMKVYIVINAPSYEPFHILGVFSKREDAERLIAKRNARDDEIQEWNADLPTFLEWIENGLVLFQFMLMARQMLRADMFADCGLDDGRNTLPRVELHEAGNGDFPKVEDCGFRMLQPHEIKAAMAFPQEYIIKGGKREQVKQLGNAVTPPVMGILMQRIVETFQ